MYVQEGPFWMYCTLDLRQGPLASRAAEVACWQVVMFRRSRALAIVAAAWCRAIWLQLDRLADQTAADVEPLPAPRVRGGAAPSSAADPDRSPGPTRSGSERWLRPSPGG